jgi:hypothetical protein
MNDVLDDLRKSHDFVASTISTSLPLSELPFIASTIAQAIAEIERLCFVAGAVSGGPSSRDLYRHQQVTWVDTLDRTP